MLLTSLPVVFLTAQALSSGAHIDRTISPSEKQSFSVDLQEGGAIVGSVDQKGVSVLIDFQDDGGKIDGQVGPPFVDQGQKPFDFTARQRGTYRLVLYPARGTSKAGAYSLIVDKVLGPEENALRLAKDAYGPAGLFELWQDAKKDPDAVSKFVASHPKPLVQPIPGRPKDMRITYFCLGDADSVSATVNGGPDWVIGEPMRRLGKTNLFFTTDLVPSDSRISYSYAIREMHRLGPSGEVEVPEVVPKGDGLLELPDAPPQPYAIEKPGVAQGKLTEAMVQSKSLGEERKVGVYTPAGYETGKPCKLLIVFDGVTYGGGAADQAAVPGPTILNNLIAEHKIEPTVAVFVWTMGKRNRDLTGSPPFAEFVGDELVKWARENYRVAPGPEAVAAAGSSFGGFCASFCALRHPEAIGNVLSQSGAYWITADWQSVRPPYPHDPGMLMEMYARHDRMPIKFYLEVGRFDLGASLLGTNREMRDVLIAKGYTVDYREFDGGHDYACWRGSFADGLISLFGQ